MATFERFEDIEGWIKARELTRHIYRISSQGPFSRDFELRGQMRRASVSIMSNIAEGFERDGRKEFIQFLTIAKGSCGEVRSQLYVALDQQYIDNPTCRELLGLAHETSNLIGGLIRYLKRTDHSGTKFKPADE